MGDCWDCSVGGTVDGGSLTSTDTRGLQDPAMSGMLSNLTNPAHKEQLEQRMAAVREDPTLKPVLEEIETGGPAAMMKSVVGC